MITRELEAQAGDERYREGVSRVVPGAERVYGVRVPQLRAIARQVAQIFGKQMGAVEEIADACWQTGSREHRVLAILVLTGIKRLPAARRWELGLRYLTEVGDWETCDHLCMGLLGQALVEAPGYMQELERWADDPNFWVRRAALATTVMLRRLKAAPDLRRSLDQRTLAICMRLLDDDQHYVRKAVDWAVREVIRRDYDLGKRWLLERSQTRLTSIARSTLKKAAKKLKPADQSQFLMQLG